MRSECVLRVRSERVRDNVTAFGLARRARLWGKLTWNRAKCAREASARRF